MANGRVAFGSQVQIMSLRLESVGCQAPPTPMLGKCTYAEAMPMAKCEANEAGSGVRRLGRPTAREGSITMSWGVQERGRCGVVVEVLIEN